MSTKIHTGFRFTEHDIHAVHQRLMDWRAELASLHADMVARFLACTAAALIDRDALAQLEPDEVNAARKPLSSAYCQLRDRQADVKRTMRRDPDVDFDFAVAIMPHDGRLYGIAYSEHTAWVKLFLSKPWIEGYAYWNGVDHPADVTDEEWDERERTWDAVLGPAAVPAMVGFEARCTDILTPSPDVNEVLRHLKPPDLRAIAFARQRVIDRRCSMDTADAQHMSRTVRAINDAVRWMTDTDEGKAALTTETALIVPLLPVITGDMLRYGLKD